MDRKISSIILFALCVPLIACAGGQSQTAQNPDLDSDTEMHSDNSNITDISDSSEITEQEDNSGNKDKEDSESETDAQSEPEKDIMQYFSMEDEAADGKSETEDKYYDNLEIYENEIGLSLYSNEHRKIVLDRGQINAVLDEYDGMIYVTAITDIFSGEISVGRAPIEGGSVELLFKLESYDYLYNIGMAGDKFYFLYVELIEADCVFVELYEYDIEGNYKILDEWTLPYVPNYWKTQDDIFLNVIYNDKCELIKHNAKSGEREVILTTDYIANSDGSSTGVTITHGGAVNNNGFCFEAATLQNENVSGAGRYSVFYYDIDTDEIEYIYSPQRQSFFVMGDERLVIRTETQEDAPIKNPTTIYDGVTGKWGRAVIPRVELGTSILNVEYVKEGQYLLCNGKSIYLLDLDGQSVTRYSMHVNDIPEEWVQEGLSVESLVNAQLIGRDEPIICVSCGKECIILNASDILG